MEDLTQSEKIKKRELAQAYRKKLEDMKNARDKTLTKSQRKLLTSYEAFINELTFSLKKDGRLPSEALKEDFSWLIYSGVSDRNREILFWFADRIKKYPYSVSYSRRSMRSANYSSYIAKIYELFNSFLNDK